MFKSIFSKQFSMYMCILIISFTAFSIPMYNMYKNYFMTENSKALIEQARRISTVYKSDVFGQLVFNQNELEAEISVLHEYLSASFIFVDLNSKAIMTTVDISEFSGQKIELAELSKVFSGEIITEITTVGGIFKSNKLTAAYPVVINDSVIGAVLISKSMEDMNTNLKEIIKLASLCLLLSAFITFILAYFFSKTITKPLLKMNEAAKLMSSGDFLKRIDYEANDEVGQLAKNLNLMAENLSEQEELRQNFITNVSHDIRSPLTSMRGFLLAISDGTIPSEKQNHYLNIVLEETERLSKLAHEIININSVKSREIVAVKSMFDINSIIRKCVNSFETVVLEKNIAINIKFASVMTFVYADSELMQRVFLNLIDNATKFLHKGGQISIETTIVDKLLEVAISDNGPGIKLSDQKRIFDRFYKGDLSRGENKDGSGLGLSIVQTLLKAHGQQISLTSKEGEGSTFKFYVQMRSFP